MSKGMDTMPRTLSGTSAVSSATSDGRSNKIETRPLNVSGVLEAKLDWRAAARRCSAGADVRATGLTAAACAAAPPGLVFCRGELKGVSAVADADEPAYRYIAAVSCAHISAYRASVVAIAEVFCPNRLVATSLVSRVRLTATSGGGTVDANASS